MDIYDIINIFSGPSDSGLSQIRTQYKKPLYKGHILRFQNATSPVVLIQFEPPKRTTVESYYNESQGTL